MHKFKYFFLRNIFVYPMKEKRLRIKELSRKKMVPMYFFDVQIVVRLYSLSRSAFVTDANRILNAILWKCDEFRGAIVTNNLSTVPTVMPSEHKPEFRIADFATSDFCVGNPFRRAVQAPLSLKYSHEKKWSGVFV